MRYKALDYQKAGIRFMCDHPHCGVFADPGGGKTAMTLAAFSLLRNIAQVKRALIIAPRLVCYDVWPNEIQKWDQFNGLTHRILHGGEKAQSIFQEVVEPKADICLVNPEATDYLFSFFPEQWFKRKSGPPVDMPWDMLIIDESSKYKNQGSVRFKALKKYHKLFKRRVILTGTPTPNGIMDLWSQIYLLDSGASLGKNITEYRKRYFDVSNTYTSQYNTWEPKRGAADAVRKRVAPFVIRFDEKQFAELPPLVINKIMLTLPEKSASYYRSIEKDMLAELDLTGTVSSLSASAKYLLCRQIASGQHYDPEDKSKVHHVHDTKTECLQNVIDELQGKPLLIAYYFKHDLVAIRKKYPKIPNIGSDTDPTEIVEILKQWNTGGLPLLTVHPDSMSHGLNMQAGGSDLFWYTLTNSLESFLQLNKRLHRRGAREQVRIHIPIAKGTVDEAVARSLTAKERKQKSLLDALREYRDSRRGNDLLKV